MNHLILGAATTYPLEHIRPFALSLRRAGYEGHVCLLVGQLTSLEYERLQAWGVEPYAVAADRPFPRQHLQRWITQLRASRLFHLPGGPEHRCERYRIAARLHHISCSRYFYYYEYLVRHPGAFDAVMLTDVRDVFFQDDPFRFRAAAPLLFFVENGEECIQTNAYNARWMRRLYGDRALRALGDRPIVCSGTTIGRYAAVVRYLEQMSNELVRLTGRIKGRSGFDQAVHNYLVWRGRFPQSLRLDNGSGPVLTMGIERVERFLSPSNGAFVNRDGSAVAVLHQYDRHASHAQRLLATLPDASRPVGEPAD